jgi:hypothetical protein
MKANTKSAIKGVFVRFNETRKAAFCAQVVCLGAI